MRYTLYHRQNVLQSFRIAALAAQNALQYDEAQPGELDALAAALAISRDEMQPVTWLARLEYAAEPITSAHLLEERTVSLVANVAGERVVTVKGEDFFVNRNAGDIRHRVTSVRDALLAASLDMTPKRREDWQYRCGDTAAKNDASFRDALPRLALEGWRLYNRVLPYDERQKIERALQGQGGSISIAHILLEEVIPWAAVYDRMFALQDDETAEVCTVAMPDAAGIDRLEESCLSASLLGLPSRDRNPSSPGLQ